MKARVIAPSPQISTDQKSKNSVGINSLKRSHKKKSRFFTYLIIGFVALALIAATGYIYFVPPEFAYYAFPLTLDQIEKLFTHVYGKRSGYFLTPDEKNFIADNGGESSYGEILYSTTEDLLLNIFNVKDDSVLHDFGSGVGKFALQARLTTNISKIVATELSVTRAVLANEAVQKIQALGLLQPNDTRLIFNQTSFLDIDISDATHIYICSTCFHEELMQNIYKKLVNEGNPGLQIMTLVMFKTPKKQTDTPRKLVFKATHTVPMTWSVTSPGYLYAIEDNSVAKDH